MYTSPKWICCIEISLLFTRSNITRITLLLPTITLAVDVKSKEFRKQEFSSTDDRLLKHLGNLLEVAYLEKTNPFSTRPI
jgi:hypothetical protein